jgi:hypothetical protein
MNSRGRINCPSESCPAACSLAVSRRGLPPSGHKVAGGGPVATTRVAALIALRVHYARKAAGIFLLG